MLDAVENHQVVSAKIDNQIYDSELTLAAVCTTGEKTILRGYDYSLRSVRAMPIHSSAAQQMFVEYPLWRENGGG